MASYALHMNLLTQNLRKRFQEFLKILGMYISLVCRNYWNTEKHQIEKICKEFELVKYHVSR
jgi:hypothetical protein